MDPDIMVSPVISDSPASPTRRSLLALLGLGPVAGGLATLLALETTEAKKKRKKRKNKKKGGKGGGKGSCTGSVNGSASASEEVTLLQLINDFRQQNGGLPPFVRQDLLDSAAVAHSRDMVTRCFFDHINPDGKDPGDRIYSLETGDRCSQKRDLIFMSKFEKPFRWVITCCDKDTAYVLGIKAIYSCRYFIRGEI